MAASPTVAEYLLPRWLVALRRDRPGTAVSLTRRNSDDVAADVRSGAADVGFVEGPEVPDDLDAQVVATDRLTLVVAPDHPWATRRRVDAARLATTPLVSRESGSGTRSFLEHAVAARGVGALVDPVLELASTTAIKGAAADGVGPAVLSSLAVAGDLAAGTLVAVPVTGIALDRRLAAVWPRGRPLTGPAAELVALAARRAPVSGHGNARPRTEP